jgi:hypothetical protein
MSMGASFMLQHTNNFLDLFQGYHSWFLHVPENYVKLYEPLYTSQLEDKGLSIRWTDYVLHSYSGPYSLGFL